jgi:arginyl-tRNA synthetase
MWAMFAARCSATRWRRCSDFAGFEVTREYYINDGGAQVDTLARSAYLRYLEALGQEVAFAEGTYPGDYLIPVGRALAERHGDSAGRAAGGGMAADDLRDCSRPRR